MPRRPLYYTFGNHMHWVDMQWLWGYGVLPGSTADMLELCRTAGVRGNVNFDGVGYERMAAECPASLTALREAIARGVVEPVGCSYGQPYALFQGGESNVRQFTHGVRAALTTLGVRPATFWEEEFYFYPQLVQVLRRTGFSGACLFFQWTWHTPELPQESTSLIEWEGIDGSCLPALPRNALNVHQWPEDFDGLLEQGLVRELDSPAIVQWLELMPTKDWMCRSELLLPRLQQLVADPRFEVQPLTAGQLLRRLGERGPGPRRRYGPDQVWHGMTLGKNADTHPRASARAESAILAAESLAAVTSALGRPYASWDVHPTWELDEAWRETLAAQHHDNHECEGLCGFVGHASFARSMALAGEVAGRSIGLLARRAKVEPAAIAVNIHGWEETIAHRGTDGRIAAVRVPPFGYAVASRPRAAGSRTSVRTTPVRIELRRGELRAAIDRRSGLLVGLALGRRELLGKGGSVGQLQMRRGGRAVRLARPTVALEQGLDGPVVLVTHRLPGGRIELAASLAPLEAAVDLAVRIREDDPGAARLRPDAGFGAALQMLWRPGVAHAIHADAPYSLEAVRGSGRCRRKFPTGDWMTSPQWFEEFDDPFTALSLVDLVAEDGTGLLVTHDGSQQWFRDGDGREQAVRVVLTAYDPWDEARYSAPPDAACRFRIVPHATALRNAERVRIAQRSHRSFVADPRAVPVGGGEGGGRASIPPRFGMVDCSGAPGVLLHALTRDGPRAGEGLPAWAGHAMATGSEGACTHPIVVRLVEWEGAPAEVTLTVLGPVASAARTNLLGEVGPEVAGGADTAWLEVRPAKAPAWAADLPRPKGTRWQAMRFSMRPREIATVLLDVVPARKAWRDLDAKRKVWAKVHRTKSPAGRKRGRG